MISNNANAVLSAAVNIVKFTASGALNADLSNQLTAQCQSIFVPLSSAAISAQKLTPGLWASFIDYGATLTARQAFQAANQV
jgi:hypothetical protein